MARTCFIRLLAAAALLVTPAIAEDRRPLAPLLGLDEAIATAQHKNHALASSSLQLEKVDERTAALITQRLPKLRLDALGLRLLQPLEGTIPAGMGGVPSLSITRDTGWVGGFMASVAQPITQQYRIGLGLQGLRLQHQVAGEDLRRDRQRITAEVRSTYYQISATEAGVVALRDLVRAIEEVDSLTTRYLAEQTVLHSEALEVQARLARERQRLTASENSLATQREHLNQLMGREVTTPFRVSDPSQFVGGVERLSLDTAREIAAANRPEIRTAALQISQADTARKLAHADWIPDVSLVASYAAVGNAGGLPDHGSAVGVYLSWEPWDWGRRKHEADAQAVAKRQAEAGREEAEQQVLVEVGQRWRAVRDAAGQLDATRIAEVAAKAYLEDVRNRYREDANMLHDVLEAEARLSRARHDFTDALAGYWSAAAELERTIGNENS